MFRKFMRKHGVKLINGTFVSVAFALGVVVGALVLATPAPAQEGEKVCLPTEPAPVVVYMPYATTTTAEQTTETTKATTTAPRTVEVVATAYCPCEKCCGKYALNRPKDENGNDIVYTASGARAKAGRTIAVDTSVFPFGTVLTINGVEYVAEDRGGAIKGNRIDIYFDDHDEALQFGRQTLTAYL